MFSGRYGCAHIFCLTAGGQFILREPLVLRKCKTYLRFGDQQPKPLAAVYMTKKISPGAHLRTCTWLVNFRTHIFGFYAKFHAMSKKKSSKFVEKRRFYDASKLYIFSVQKERKSDSIVKTH